MTRRRWAPPSPHPRGRRSPPTCRTSWTRAGSRSWSWRRRRTFPCPQDRPRPPPTEPRKRRFQAASRLRWDLSSSLGLDIITDDLNYLIRQRRKWDLKPLPSSGNGRGDGHDSAATCGLFLPVVTARAQRGPLLSDALRTQHGPVPRVPVKPVQSGRGRLRRPVLLRPGTESAGPMAPPRVALLPAAGDETLEANRKD